MRRRKPAVRAMSPTQKARQVREAAVDALLLKAASGALSIPEGLLLAECWREERRLDALTRRRLTDTTRALERHREAAGAEIRRLEGAVAELSSAAGSPDTAPDGPRGALSSPLTASGVFGGDREGRASPGAPEGRTGDPGPDGPRRAA